MKSKRYRRKSKINAFRLFLVTVLLLVFLGFVITQRNRNQSDRKPGHKVAEEKESRDNQEVVKKILADDRRYP
ncbi:MAG: hypothetical protein J6C32_10330 [Eubacterium sp.]|nr:hypothetical protein [Eubacterium sp.]